MPEHLPLPLPEPLKSRPKHDLSPEHEELRRKVLERFSDKDYTLPGIEDHEKATLTDQEKFWLVRSIHRQDGTDLSTLLRPTIAS